MAELVLLHALTRFTKNKYNIREHAISLISVDGLKFDCFMPLFSNEGLFIPVSIITDADPKSNEINADGTKQSIYPKLGENIIPSDNTKLLKSKESDQIKIFHGVKTFEYDLALYEENRILMLEALKEIHPVISNNLKEKLNSTTENEEKAKILFCGMFERETVENVQKGRFAQSLSDILNDIDDSKKFIVPEYIEDALSHVCS